MVTRHLGFLGIDAYKSGTIWGIECLREHPEARIPKIKEVKIDKGGNIKYWNYNEGLSWYSYHFTSCENNQIKGEYNNAYLCGGNSSRLIKKHFPNIIKLVVC